ncbi:MAG: diguanylate cyclase [Acidimicrobiales bacterium]
MAILAIVLPRTTPIRWWAVSLALVLFAVLLVLQYRGSRDDDTTRSILLTAVVANAASTMGVVAANDPYGMLLFLFPIVLLGALTMRRTLDVAIPVWSMGVAGVAIASFTNGLPTNALISLTVLYAGFSLVLTSCMLYIIGSVQHLAGLAEDYGTLARVAAGTERLAEGFESGRESLLLFTGADAAYLAPEEKAAHHIAEAAGPDALVSLHALGDETDASDRPHLVLIGDVKPTAAAAVADLLAQVATRERNIEGLASRANTDPLTGINNRRGLTMKMSETDSAVYTVVLIDLDHFKSYNDTYGHIAGDHVLQAAAGVLADGMRTRDLVSRYGGEEFCMAIDGPASAALAIVDRIRDAWDASDLLPVTFSAGVAERRISEEWTHVLARADAALYEAKEHGRNRTHLSIDPADLSIESSNSLRKNIEPLG